MPRGKYIRTEETKKKISKAKKGKSPWNKGLESSEEAKKKFLRP